MFDTVSEFIEELFQPLIAFIEGLYPFGGFIRDISPWITGLGSFFTAFLAMIITIIAVRFVAKLL